ncbi:MAG: penicillin acylase family protein [Sphingomonadales bacterium]|nr:penicillin acylase family protein [Sphingomonadales bacterium]
MRNYDSIRGAWSVGGRGPPALGLAGGPGAAAQSGTPSATASPATAGDITIYRDEMGVPHVYADTAPAVFFGGSYAIAQDRLAQSGTGIACLAWPPCRSGGAEHDRETTKRPRIALPTDASMQAQYDRPPADYQAIMKECTTAGSARARGEGRSGVTALRVQGMGHRTYRMDDARVPQVMGDGLPILRHRRWWPRTDESRALQGSRRQTWRGGCEEDLRRHAALQDPDAVPIFPAAEIQTYQSGQPRLTVLQGELPLEKLDPPPRSTAARREPGHLISADKSASGNTMILQATADGPDLHLSGGGFEGAGCVFSRR